MFSCFEEIVLIANSEFDQNGIDIDSICDHLHRFNTVFY